MTRALLIFAALCAAGAIPARATTMYSISPPNVFVGAGDSGAGFDVILTNFGPDISVAGFSFEVTVSGSDVTLLGANYSTSLSYIFDGDSFDQTNSAFIEGLCGCPNSLSVSDNVDTTDQTLVANDITNDGAGITVATGESIALGHVVFSVAPGTPLEDLLVNFTGNASGVVADSNSLSDASFSTINLTFFAPGDINVIPEPSSVWLMTMGIATLIGAFCLSNRKSRPV